MTEMTDKARRPLHDIDAAVFAIALIAAPFLVALLFFWVYFIPVFAILFGGLPWLLCGGPVLWWTIRTCGPGPLRIRRRRCCLQYP